MLTAPSASAFAARVAFVGLADSGAVVVDVLTERGPLALRTMHRPGAAGWHEWTTLAMVTLRRWAEDGAQVSCRIAADGAGKRCDLDDGTRRLRLDLLGAPRRAVLPGSVTCATTQVRSSALPPPARRRGRWARALRQMGDA